MQPQIKRAFTRRRLRGRRRRRHAHLQPCLIYSSPFNDMYIASLSDIPRYFLPPNPLYPRLSVQFSSLALSIQSPSPISLFLQKRRCDCRGASRARLPLSLSTVIITPPPLTVAREAPSTPLAL